MSERCRCLANAASLIRPGLILPSTASLREFPCRLDDLGAAAVVHAVVDGDDVVVDRHLLGDVELLDDAAPHARPRTDPAHPDAHVVQVLAAPADHLAVEAHQEAHLLGAALPVLGGERVHRQVLDADFDGAAGDVDEHRLAHLVALGAAAARAGWPTGRCRPSRRRRGWAPGRPGSAARPPSRCAAAAGRTCRWCAAAARGRRPATSTCPGKVG